MKKTIHLLLTLGLALALCFACIGVAGASAIAQYNLSTSTGISNYIAEVFGTLTLTSGADGSEQSFADSVGGGNLVIVLSGSLGAGAMEADVKLKDAPADRNSSSSLDTSSVVRVYVSWDGRAVVSADDFPKRPSPALTYGSLWQTSMQNVPRTYPYVDFVPDVGNQLCTSTGVVSHRFLITPIEDSYWETHKMPDGVAYFYVDIDVTVNPLPVTVTYPTANSRSYDRANSTCFAAADFSFEPALISGDTFSLTGNTNTEAGTYPVTVSLDAAKYTLTNPTAQNFTIDKVHYSYGATATGLVYSGNSQTDSIVKSIDYVLSDAAPLLDSERAWTTLLQGGSDTAFKDAGTHEVTLTVSNANYVCDTATKPTVTIAKSEITYSLDSSLNLVYKDKDYTTEVRNALSFASSNGGATPGTTEYQLSFTDANGSPATPEKAGTYRLTVALNSSAASNYDLSTQYVEFTIAKSEITYDLPDSLKSMTYDGTERYTTVQNGLIFTSLNGGRIPIAYLTGIKDSVGTPVASIKNAGEYLADITIDDNADCYDVKTTNVPFSVRKASVTYSVSPTKLTFDGSDRRGNIALTFSSSLVTSADYTQRFDKGGITNVSPSKPGDYVLVPVLTEAASRNIEFSASSTGAFTIEPYKLNVQIKDQTYTYHSINTPDLTATRYVTLNDNPTPLATPYPSYDGGLEIVGVSDAQLAEPNTYTLTGNSDFAISSSFSNKDCYTIGTITSGTLTVSYWNGDGKHPSFNPAITDPASYINTVQTMTRAAGTEYALDGTDTWQIVSQFTDAAQGLNTHTYRMRKENTHDETKPNYGSFSFFFDNIAPVFGTETYVPTDASKPATSFTVTVPIEGVTATTESPVDESSIQVTYGTGSAVSYTLSAAKDSVSFTASRNGNYTLNCKDVAGNVATPKTLSIQSVDTRAPVYHDDASIDPIGLTNQDVTVTFHATDDCYDSDGNEATNARGNADFGINTVSVDNGATDLQISDNGGGGTRREVTFAAVKNGAYTATITDYAGNQSTPVVIPASSPIGNIDKALPELVSVAFAPPMTQTAGSAGKVTMTVKAKDHCNDGQGNDTDTARYPSGVRSISVTGANGTSVEKLFSSYANESEVTAEFVGLDRNDALSITVTDWAGNASTYANHTAINNIDVVAPLVGPPALDKTTSAASAVGSVSVQDRVQDSYGNNGDTSATSVNGIVSIVASIASETPTVRYTPVMGDTPILATFPVERNGEYSVTATDATGKSASARLTVDSIDSVAPNDALSDVTRSTLDSVKSVIVGFDVQDDSKDRNGTSAKDDISVHGMNSVTVTSTGGNASVQLWPAAHINAQSHVDATITRNGEYTVVLQDKAGNSTTVTEKITVRNIDTAAPVNAIRNYQCSSTAPTSGGVDVSFVVNDLCEDANHIKSDITDNTHPCGIRSVEIAPACGGTVRCSSVNGEGDVLVYVDDIAYNGVYKVTLTDRAGNVTEILNAFTINNIDATAPKDKLRDVTLTPTVSTKGSVVVCFTVNDICKDTNGNPALSLDCGMRYATVRGLDTGDTPTINTDIEGGEKDATVTFTAIHNDQYEITLYDTAGNSTVVTEKIAVENIDQAAPENAFALPVSQTPLDSTKSSVAVRFLVCDLCKDAGGNTATGAMNGLASITVAGALAGNAPTANYTLAPRSETVPVTFTADKNDTYTVTLTDKAGNQTVMSDTIKVGNLDAAAPVDSVTGIALTPATSTTGGVGVSFKVKDVCKDAHGNSSKNDVRLNGLDTVVLTHTNGTEYHALFTPPTNVEDEVTASTMLSLNGDYTVTLTDKAGNKTVCQTKIHVGNIDILPPIGGVDDYTLTPSISTKGAVIVSFNAQDLVKSSGNYAGDSDPTLNGLKTVEITCNRPCDPITANWTAPAKAEDAIPVTFTATVNGEYTVKLTDKAGNETVCGSIHVGSIDAVAPVDAVGHLALDPATSAPGAVKVTFDVADVVKDAAGNLGDDDTALNGMATIEIACSRSADPITASWTAPVHIGDAIPVEFTATVNGDYTVKLTDKAGNVTTCQTKIHVGNIDAVAPVDAVGHLALDPATSTPGTVKVTFDVADVVKDAAGNLGDDDVTLHGMAAIEVTRGSDAAAYATTWAAPAHVGDAIPVEFTADVNGDYTVKLTDKAGHVTTCAAPIHVGNIDAVAPANAVSNLALDPATSASGTVKVTFDVADVVKDAAGNLGDDDTALNGMATIEVTRGSSATYPATWRTPAHVGDAIPVAFTADVNGDYTVTLTDKAGNRTTCAAPIHVGNIDRAAPADQLTNVAFNPAELDGAGRIQGAMGAIDVTFTVRDVCNDKSDGTGNAADTDSDVNGIAAVKVVGVSNKQDYGTAWTARGGESALSVTFTADTNQAYKITVTDKAGNARVLTDRISVSTIDTEAPRITASASNGKLRVTVSENLQLDSVSVRVGKASLLEHSIAADESATRFEKTVTMTKSGQYTITAVDTAGHVAVLKIGNVDTDGDGLSDDEEAKHNCDPNNPDTDGDGLKDGDEVYKYKTQPDVSDTDHDGLDDGIEVESGLSPLEPDSDFDGVGDAMAYQLGIHAGDAFWAARLILAHAYTPIGESCVGSAFADSADALMTALSDAKLLTDEGAQDLSEQLANAKRSIKADKLRDATLVQLDTGSKRGLAVAGGYLLAFDGSKSKVGFNAAIDLRFMGAGEYIVLPSADGSMALVAVWDGSKAVGELGLVSMTTGRVGRIAGSDGANSFAISANGGKVSYRIGDSVTVVDLLGASSDTRNVGGVISLGFDGDTPVAATDENRSLALRNGGWTEATASCFDLTQRTNRTRDLRYVDYADDRLNLDADITLPTNGSGVIEFHNNQTGNSDKNVSMLRLSDL